MRTLTVLFMLLFAVQPFVMGQNRSGSGRQTGSGGNPMGESVNALSRLNSAVAASNDDISGEDAYYLGRAVGAHILGDYKPWDNPRFNEYIEKICSALTANSPAPDIFNGYHIMLLDSPELNAISTPGGHIFITRALAELAESEDMLAALIAHEIAHIQLKHAEGIIRNMKLTEDLSAIGADAARTAARAANLNERTTLFHNSITELVNTLVVKGYSRTQEYEADAYALRLLSLSGYNPQSLPAMLAKLEAAQRKAPKGGFGSTHPSPADRIKNAGQKLEPNRNVDTSSYRQERFKAK
jgi:predicted Zn-dependent protease